MPTPYTVAGGMVVKKTDLLTRLEMKIIEIEYNMHVWLVFFVLLCDWL